MTWGRGSTRASRALRDLTCTCTGCTACTPTGCERPSTEDDQAWRATKHPPVA